MSHEIVLFHSALGLRPGVVAFADRLRALGHTVHTPDLFDGEVFTDLEAGARKRDSLGIPALIERAHAAVARLPPPLVLAGFSMGSAAAEVVAATRPGALGAILMHGALAPAAAGLESWPRVPVQIHFSVDDPGVDHGQVEALVAGARAAGVAAEEHRYPGSAHLFTDPDLPEHDPASARLLLERVEAFLRAIPSGTAT